MPIEEKPHPEYPEPTPQELDEFIRELEKKARKEGWEKPSPAAETIKRKDKIISDLEKDGWELAFSAPEEIFRKTNIIFPPSTKLKKVQLGRNVFIFKKEGDE